MADDIDDLLDEVENKFCSAKEEPKKKKNQGSASQYPGEQKKKHNVSVGSKTNSTSSIKSRREKDELNQAIEDIFQEDQFTLDKPLPTQCHQAKNVNDSSRCFPVNLGGTRYLQGLGTTVSPRACDKLHCISCDNKVISFDNFAWNDSASSYLFFRNNYPDFGRLKQALMTLSGSRAYACQCSWKSVKGLEDTKSHTSLKWVCTKH